MRAPPRLTAMGIRRAQFDHRFELEALEPRVMLSADGMAAWESGAEPGAHLQLSPGTEWEREEDQRSDAFDVLNDALMIESAGPVWINAAGGDWSDAVNWADGIVPAAGDHVTLAGLEADATITLTGNTPALGSLTIESGNLVLNGALTTAQLTVAAGASLTLNGATTSVISGNVDLAEGGSLTLSGSATLNWTAGSFITRGHVSLEPGTTLNQSSVDLHVWGGVFHIGEGAWVDLVYTWSDFLVYGGELIVDGTLRGFGNVEQIIYEGGRLSGSGTMINARAVALRGVINPGGAGAAGTLTIAAAVDFSGPWSLQLDVLGAGEHDALAISGAVSFGGTGSIVVNASAADFGAVPSGTALGGALLTAGGTVTGTPAIQVTDGAGFTVDAVWNAGVKQVLATTVTLQDPLSQIVSAGLLAGTATYQAMLASYNLGTIDLAAQGRTPFTLPGLALNLADALDLTSLSSLVALPTIGATATLAELISQLEAAGFQVTQPGNGVELRGFLSRTVAEGLTLALDAADAFALPAELTAGWADELDLAIIGELTARLSQNIVFEVRDGVFVLAVDPLETSHFYLAISGAAAVAGSARSGGRTVSVEGEINVAYEIWMHHVTGGPTPKAAGTGDIELRAGVGALYLTLAANALRTTDSFALTTTSTDTQTLGGVLRFDGLTAADGAPLALAMTGERAGDASSWTLMVAGSEARLLNLNVGAWELSAALSPTVLAGAGTLSVEFDFLRVGGQAPAVALSATFDADALTLAGGIGGSVGIATPGGTTYLTATDFTGALELATVFGSAAWTGAGFNFTAGAATYGGDGATISGSVTDGDDADAHALIGTYDFTTQSVTTVVDQLELMAATMVQLTVAGVALRHTRNGTDEQELAKIDAVPVALLFLTTAPSTGPPSLQADLTLRTDGLQIGGGSATVGDITLGAGVTLTGAHVTVGGFAFFAGSEIEAVVTLSAASATLFPDSTLFTATATGLSGTYDFSAATDRLVLNAESLSLSVGGRVEVNAEDIELRPEGDVVLSAATLGVTLPGLGVSGSVNGFELGADGTISVTGLALDTSGLNQSLRLAGLLPFSFDAIEVVFLGDENGNGVRDDGETFRLDEFDLTVAGRFNFGVLAALPFTPVIRIGEQTADDGTDEISFTLRFAEGTWAPWNLGPIELGVGSLTVGESFSFSGSITLGGYVEGAWVPDFHGSLELTATSTAANFEGNLTADIVGSLDLETGVLAFAADFTVSFTLGEFVEVSDAVLALSVTVRTVEEDGSFSFAAPEIGVASASVGHVMVAINGLIELEANDATLNFMATGDETLLTAASLSATSPALGVTGTLTGLEVGADGSLFVTALSLDTSGLSQSLRLAGILPFSFDAIEVVFLGDENGNGVRDDGETFRLDEFDLTVAGRFNFGVLAALPFTPVIRIGEQTADDGTDEISFTLRFAEGTWAPWNLGPIELGVSDLAVGASFSFSGTIMLGGYAEGAWVPDFGGTLAIAAASGSVTGNAAVNILGSFDAETGVLDLAAEFSIGFTLGEYVEVSDAGISFSLGLRVIDDESGSFTFADPEVTLGAASVGLVRVAFGEVLVLSATEANFDFAASGAQPWLFIGTLAAELPAAGFSGAARNFGVRADGSLVVGADFGVSLELGDGGAGSLLLPEWLPLNISVLELQWPDLVANPLDFTLRLSADVDVSSLSGSALTLAGSVSDLIIDLGLLLAGRFPVIGLGEVGLMVGGSIGGTTIEGALLLGLLRLDAAGEIIAADDTETDVATRVLWGAVRGEIEIASVGGLTLWLGLSQLGPLQGYVSAAVPVVIDPTGLTGLTLNNFRAGITFHAELPAITDARDLRNDPGFTPVGELTFAEWQELMLGTLRAQIAANAEHGTFAILASPFRLDGGVTIYSSYVSSATFKIEADFAMDSTGRFFARGKLVAGDSISLTARFYFDLSRIATDGEVVILFLADAPSEFPLLTVFGGLTLNFGVEIDPQNPPANPLEQFTITITGGWELGLPDLPAITADGSVRFEIALNAPSLRTVIEGVANIAGLGDVVSLAGDLDLFFGDDDTVQLVGVVALAPGEFAVLRNLGLSFDGVAVLRFNTTADDATRELQLPAEATPRVFVAPARSAGLLLEGRMGFSLLDVELYRVDGVFGFTWAGNTFDVLAAGVLTAGPTTAPLLRTEAEGYLKIVFDGIDVGLAALFTLSLNDGDNLFAAIGVELRGALEFRLNTTGTDVDYTLTGAEAGAAAITRIHLPRGPPLPDGTPADTAQAYAMVRATGVLDVSNLVTLDGVFDLTVSGDAIDLNYIAQLALEVAGTPLLTFAVEGRFRLDAAGLYGEAALTLTHEGDTAALGFGFAATFSLQINTTGAEQELGGKVLPAGNYARTVATGALVTDGVTLAGEFFITADEDGLAFAAVGTLGFGVGDVRFVEFSFAGTLRVFSDGIFGELTLSRTVDGSAAFGFGFAEGASYTLALNTTPVDRDGVPAGLGAQVRVEGVLQVGGVSLDGIYTLTGATTGFGFAAAAALIFRDGEAELFRLPVEFALEITFPGIAERLVLEIDPADLGVVIPGFAWAGAFQLEINTTPEVANGIPAGPIFRAGFVGTLQLGTLALEGSWFFDASLSRTQVGGTFALSLGVPDAAPMISWAGTANFNLGLNGVAGYAALTVESVVAPMSDLLVGDFAFELLVNTTANAFELGDRTLPAGPLAAVKSSGTLNVGGWDLVGEFFFSASPGGVVVSADAELSVTVGEAVTLFTFTTQGAFILDAGGLAAAMDVMLTSQAWASVGVEFSGGADFRLRINTTGEAREVGGVELEAGNYTRLEFTGAISVGTFALRGDFTLTTGQGAAELALNGVMEAWLPGAESASFRLGAVGGMRIDPAGVAAAFDLDANLAGGSIDMDGVELPFGAEQTIALRLNTTGEERTLNGIVLEAGSYFALRTTGQLVLGAFVLRGDFGFVAADTGFSLEAGATFGIGAAGSELFRFGVLGEIRLTAAGTFAALTLASEVGDGFGEYGFGFGAGASFTLAFNATDAEIDGIPARTPWTLRVVGTLKIGDGNDGAGLTGVFRLTPTAQNTLLLRGETHFVLLIDGAPWIEVPFAFEHEIVTPGLAFRIALVDLSEDDLGIPGVSFEDGAFYLQVNASPQAVEFAGDVIPAGPRIELVYAGTLNIGWAALEGDFAFAASGDGVELALRAALRFGDRASPFLLLSGEGAMVVDSSGFAGRIALTVSGGVATVAGPLGGALTHELYLNTRDAAVTVAGVELPAGPVAELRSTGVLELLGLAFVGSLRTTASGEGFSMAVDATLEIRVPVIGTVLMSVPVLGGFTIGPQGFSAAFDVVPTTAFFEPVGLVFGGEATYRLRINTTGEARQENGIALEAGSYARIDSTGTMSLGVLAITGGYSFQVDDDLVRIGVIGEAVLTVPGEGPGAGELLRTAVGGLLGIGEGGVVGALDAAVGAGAPQFALGEMALPVGAEFGSRIRINTTGSERVVAGYTMAENETFMWETSATATIGVLRLAGLNRFTAGDDLVRWESVGRAALLSPASGAAEILAGTGTIAIEVNAHGAAGLGLLAGAPAEQGSVDLGVGLDFSAELTLRFNTTGEAVTLNGVTLEAGHYFEAGVSGALQVLGQRIDGTHFVRVSDGAVAMRSQGTLTFGLTDVLQMTFGADLAFVFADDGFYGTGALTVGTAIFDAQGAGVNLAAGTTPIFAINTSSTAQEIAGATLAPNSVSLGLGLDITLFGQRFAGQAALTVDDGRGLVVLRHAGTLALTVGDWVSYTFSYDGFFVFGAGGVVTNLELTRTGGAGVAGFGVVGSWSLRASTFAQPVTVPGFSVGGVSVPTVTIESSPMLRVHLSGSLHVAGINLAGEFDFEALPDRLTLHSAFSVSALGVTMSGAGALTLFSNGVVADIALSGPSVSNAFYTMAGDYVLRLNTTSATVNGIPASYARVAVNNAVISVPGATLRGAASIDFAGGVTLRVDGLTATLDVPMLGGAALTINGWMNSAGQFNVSGTTTLNVGNTTTFGIQGATTITISHDQGIRGTISNGRLYVPGGDWATLDGSFAATMTSFNLTVNQTAFVLLGGIVRVDGGFSVSWANSVFEVAVSNAVLTTQIPGWNTTASINGWIRSDDTFSLTGSTALNVGSYPPNENQATLEQRNWTLGMRAAVSLHVTQAGISGTAAGLIFVPGDWAGFNGTFSAGSWGFDLTMNSRFVLLGGAVLLDGSFRAELRNGTLTFAINNLTAESRIPGVASLFTVSGFINSNGAFHLEGDATLAMGLRSTAGIFGDVRLIVSSAEGITASIRNAELVVPGGTSARFDGSLRLAGDRFEVEIDWVQFTLLNGLATLAGSFRVETGTNWVHIDVRQATATVGLPGFGSSWTVSGYLNANGHFALHGTTQWDFRLGGQRLASGELEVSLRHDDGFHAVIRNGELHVPGGDHARLDGSMRVSGSQLVVEVDQAAFVLLGGLVRVDGTFRVEVSPTFMHVEVKAATVLAGLPGFGGAFSVTGYLNSAGNFDLRGTTQWDFRLGGQRFASGNLEVQVRQDEGFHAVIRNGELHVPGGDHGHLNGSLRASGSQLVVEVDQTAFVLLGGLVRVDGTFRVEITSSFMHVAVKNATVLVGLPGFGGAFSVTGYVNSAGNFDLRGTTQWDFRIGSQRFASGTLDVQVRQDEGVYAAIRNGEMHVPGGDYGRLTGSLRASGSQLIVEVDQTAFVLLGGLVRVDGTFRVEVTSNFMHIDVKSATVRLGVPNFGSTFAVSGYVNSAGHFDLRGATSLVFGDSTLGVNATVNVQVAHHGISGTASGRVDILGDWSNFSGSFSAGSWGFNLMVENFRVRVIGAVILEGSFRLEGRSGVFTLVSNGVWAHVGNTLSVGVAGYINSRGQWDLQGWENIRLGHWSVVEFEGRAELRVSRDFNGLKIIGDMWVFHSHFSRVESWATFHQNELTFGLHADGNFFDIFRFRGWVAVKFAGGGVRLDFDIKSWAWGAKEGYTWGFVDTRHGQFDFQVNIRLWYDIGNWWGGANFRAEISMGSNGFQMGISGSAWAVGISKTFRTGISVGRDGIISGHVGGVKYSINLKYGGVSIKLSDVSGSVVFLDANHNGVLDDGEPWTIADAQGNFDFSEVTSITPVAPTLFELLDRNGDGLLSNDEAMLRIVGGTRLPDTSDDEATAAITELAGVTAFAGAVVFIDLNGDGVRGEDEPGVVTDEAGAYSLFELLMGSGSGGPNEPEPDSPGARQLLLGALAAFDLNENGVIDAHEGVLYVVGGRINDPTRLVTRVYRDSNANGTADADEIFVLTAPGEGEAVFILYQQLVLGQDAPIGLLAAFDQDGDGRLSASELSALRFETLPGDAITAPLAIEGFSRGLPADGYDYVFLDLNGNGIFDEGEPQAFPDAGDWYSFAPASEEAGVVDPLGRLRPFDLNGNGVIDFEEGVFVIVGGTDNDNGVTNPVRLTASAAGYGQGFGETLSPLSSLQLSLIAGGMTPEAAADAVAANLGLGSGTALTLTNPDLAPDSFANLYYAASARVSSFVVGGASLTGDATDGDRQGALFSALAARIAAGTMDFEDPSAIRGVLETALGNEVSADSLAIASQALATINQVIGDAAAQGGSIDRELAALKAVVYTNVTNVLSGVANGSVDPAIAAAMLSRESLQALADEVELVVSLPPTLGELGAPVVHGGDVLSLFIPLSDPDTPLSRLRLGVQSSDASLIDASRATFTVAAEGWILTVPTAAVAEGNVELVITVSDGSTSISTAVAVVIDGLNPAVMLVEAPSAQTLASGQQRVIELSEIFFDADGDATYTLQAVGQNRVVDARIVGGQLVLTADTGLAGVAVFDLTASDAHGAVTTRFSVVTYPMVTFDERVTFDANGRAGIDIRLSVPSTQTLVFSYRAGDQLGSIVFLAGETSQRLLLDPAYRDADGATVRALEFGVNGGWVNGTFHVALNSYTAAELIGLRRDAAIVVEFTFAYRFLLAEADEAEVIVLASLSSHSADATPDALQIRQQSEVVRSSVAASADLDVATSLKSLQQPRALRGI